MPVTDVGMQVSVDCGGLPILGVDPMQVLAGPPTMAANTPVTLQTTTTGVHGTWEDIVLTNASAGSFLKWTAAVLAPNAAGISLSKSAYTGNGLAGVGSETINLTSTILVAGTYMSTVRFTDSEGVLPDVDVTVNLTVVPPFTGPLPCVANGMDQGVPKVNEDNHFHYSSTNRWAAAILRSPEFQTVGYWASSSGLIDPTKYTGPGWYGNFMKGLWPSGSKVTTIKFAATFDPSDGHPKGTVHWADGDPLLINGFDVTWTIG
jgi:hypothetical protein